MKATRKTIFKEVNQFAVLYYVVIILCSSILRNFDMVDMKMGVLFDTWLYAYILPCAMIVAVLCSFIESPVTRLLCKVGSSLLLFILIGILLPYDPMLSISRVMMYVGILIYLGLLIYNVIQNKGR